MNKLVVRLNSAAVHGFERDAGSLTTIRLMYPEGAPHSANEYKKTTMVALVVFKGLDLDWLTSVITKQPLVFQQSLLIDSFFYVMNVSIHVGLQISHLYATFFSVCVFLIERLV